jgi:hypothetical protein
LFEINFGIILSLVLEKSIIDRFSEYEDLVFTYLKWDNPGKEGSNLTILGPIFNFPL